MPTVKDVQLAWQDIVEEDKSDAIKEISLLSAGQKRVLQKIAQEPNAQLTAKESMMEMNMTSSSIIAALDGLLEKDVIEKEEHGYTVINPVVKFYAAKALQS